MAHIPPGAEWYVAELVERVAVEGSRRRVAHVNICLIHASSPTEAYDKAIALGKAGEVSYENPAGKRVSITFVGLRDLNVIHDDLEDGAELLYEEHLGLDEKAIRRLARPRSRLGVFRPIARSRGPDYTAGDILEEARLTMGGRTGR